MSHPFEATIGMPCDLHAKPSSRKAAATIVAAYERLEPLHDKVQWTQRISVLGLLEPGNAALVAAARAMAAVIDSDPLHFDRNLYHYRQHFCEVVLAVSVLADIHRLPTCDTQLLLLAALAHDLVHDGRPSRGFRLERRSVELAAPFLAAARVDAFNHHRFAAMVLATEPAEDVRCALRAQRFHAHGGARPAVPDAAPELAALMDDARLSRLAVLLCEADVLPSVGLTVAHSLRVQERLSHEWGFALAAAHKLAFVDDVLSCGLIGPSFATSTALLRDELATLVSAPVGP